jgi:hypothetical protein
MTPRRYTRSKKSKAQKADHVSSDGDPASPGRESDGEQQSFEDMDEDEEMEGESSSSSEESVEVVSHVSVPPKKTAKASRNRERSRDKKEASLPPKSSSKKSKLPSSTHSARKSQAGEKDDTHEDEDEDTDDSENGEEDVATEEEDDADLEEQRTTSRARSSVKRKQHVYVERSPPRTAKRTKAKKDSSTTAKKTKLRKKDFIISSTRSTSGSKAMPSERRSGTQASQGKRKADTKVSSGERKSTPAKPPKRTVTPEHDESDDESHESETPEYEVEKLLAHQVVSETKRGRKYEYLIKWANYPETENSWEPEENLIGATAMLDAYWKKIEEGDQANTLKRKRGRPSKKPIHASQATEQPTKPRKTKEKTGSVTEDEEEVERNLYGTPDLSQEEDNSENLLTDYGYGIRSQPPPLRRSTPLENEDEGVILLNTSIEQANEDPPVAKGTSSAADAPYDQDEHNLPEGDWSTDVQEVAAIRGSLAGKSLSFLLKL